MIMLCGDVELNPGPSLHDQSTDSNCTNSSSSIATSESNVSKLLKSCLSMVHLNIQSIKPKLHTIEYILKDFDLLCFTESWLNSDTDDNDIILTGFQKPFRNDRNDRPGGGVIVYAKKNVYCKRRYDFELPGLECIWIEIKNRHNHLLCGTFYRPPNSQSNVWDLIENSIELAFDSNIKDIIITGDFNENQLDPSKSKIRDITLTYNLHQLVSDPTSYTETSSTLIDLLLTNNPNLVELCEVSQPFLNTNRKIVEYLAIYLLTVFINLSKVYSQCTFPANLNGDWISADKGILYFNSTHISGYTHTFSAPGLPTTFTLGCREIQGSKYSLKAEESASIFAVAANFHTCLEIHEVNSDLFYYYIGKKTGSNINTTCPTDLQSVFSNLTITDSTGTELCPNSSLSACLNRAELDFVQDDCGKTTLSAGNNYRCIYSQTNTNGTYLSLYNTDATVDGTSTFRFACFAYKRGTATMYATESPKFCASGATPYDLPTDGRKYVYASIQATPEPPFVADLNYLFIIVAFVCIFLIIHIIVLARLLYKDYGCICLKKNLFKWPKKVKEIDIKKRERVKPIKFKTVATIATKLRAPYFRPKREINIYPIFDRSWDPMTLTEISVPQITTIYNDSIEEFMKGRLPRSASRNSLYSFDTIPWSSEATDSSSISSYSSY
ncbi:hypothetical protein FSP39_004356 [Pinctada imbricata]|uniref:Endonuclease/exonuclease/phosphatase domain-containing protein n=1 Tax=Pinctada imbricata TaxID=66713 RepID=A0AA89BMV6_PINIB|nr:hypothetical protein FSP39_004356 [Pinctada imbricata]